MKVSNNNRFLFAAAACLASASAYSQLNSSLNNPFEVPQAAAPSQSFSNSTEHYEYLYQLYDGGVTHTHESVPKWEGVYTTAGNQVARGTNMFLDEDGEIVEGILTPEYEAAFQHRLDIGELAGNDGVDWDRLTTCEPAGMPRWLLEPYTREFVNTPTQSWWMNDLANDTRRIYINQEHQNIDGTHYPNGDSVGFWTEDDRLIVHTVDVYPNDYFRSTPPTSNQFESVEVFWEEVMPNGEKKLIANATFYDELSLLEPITVTYTFSPAPQMVAAGYRVRHWECESNDNTFLTFDENGNPTTQFRLPGEEGFNDPRGIDRGRNPDLPPDLPGQEKNPIFTDNLGDDIPGHAIKEMTMKALAKALALSALLAVPAFGVLAQEYDIPENTPFHIRQAVESAARSGEDTARDAGRRPAEVLTLTDLNAGDHVIELSALGQYYSRIMAAALGPNGQLEMYDLPAFEEFGAAESGREFAQSQANVDHYMVSYDEADYPSGVDAVYNVLSYHDMPAFGVDTAAMNASLFEALMPGGKYIVIDHKAEAGSRWRDAAELHRIDPEVIIEEVTAAGFELVGSSDLLANPEDDKSMGVFSARGNTDRAILVFQKPL